MVSGGLGISGAIRVGEATTAGGVGAGRGLDGGVSDSIGAVVVATFEPTGEGGKLSEVSVEADGVGFSVADETASAGDSAVVALIGSGSMLRFDCWQCGHTYQNERSFVS